MRLKFSLITRRQFLNTLFGGWLIAFLSGGFYTLLRFAFPTLGKEPDFVVLNTKDFAELPTNSVKPFAWGGKLGFIFKRPDNKTVALKGVCTHMECNITYRPEDKRFYCPCHKGWFDIDGRVLEGPPPKALEFLDLTEEGEKLIVAKKGIKVELPKA